MFASVLSLILLLFAPPPPEWVHRYTYQRGDDAPCVWPTSSIDSLHCFAIGWDHFRSLAVAVGTDESGNLREWTWDGTGWFSQLVSIEDVHHKGGVFDSTRRVAVSLDYTSGVTCAETQTETWEWNGEVLVLKQPPVLPPPRSRSGGMVYDLHRQVIVLLGGWYVPQCGGGTYNDIWEYDGTTWINRGTLPFARSVFVAVYDPVRHTTWVVVPNDNAQRIDVWGWDGDQWFLTYPKTRPPYDRNLIVNEAVFHEKRQRVVIHGWYIPQPGSGEPLGPWEWDGYRWYHYQFIECHYDDDGEYVCTDTEPHKYLTSLVYDNNRQTMLVLDGGQ